MARSIKSPIDNRTSRLGLAARKKPYAFTPVAKGIALGYRRTASGDGRWVVRCADGEGGNWQKVLNGTADDFNVADGEHTLDFHQAAERARAMVRGGGDENRRDKPITNADALLAYKRDLEASGRDATNATRVLRHLPEWLAALPVSSSTKNDYRQFRIGLAKSVAMATVVRICKMFAAALASAAEGDDRITNSAAWKSGFGGVQLANTGDTENHASDDQIKQIVAGCYAADPALGLFAEVGAQTGARPIQIVNLKIASLKANPPRLMVPASDKGKKKNPPPVPVPITQALADRLRTAAGNRRATEPLLLQADGKPWSFVGSRGVQVCDTYREPFMRVAAEVGLPPEFSFYGLRHSSIIRQLLQSVPTRIVAAVHDTSVPIIEKHYGSYIADFSDDLIRKTLLDTAPALDAANVLPIRRA